MSYARPLLGALAAAAVLTAGCGSSSSSKVEAKPATAPAPAVAAPATPTGPVPSKATYVRRADRICREARGVSQRANTLVQKAFAAQQSDQAADAIDRYMPLFAGHVAELKGLRMPKGDHRVLKGLMKIMDAQVQALVQESKALRDQDNMLLQQIGASQQQSVAFAEELAKQYGFKVCGRAA